MSHSDTSTETDTSSSDAEVSFAAPGVNDGTAVWELARDSGTLDLNSRYSYLLWCRDFAATSVIAHGPQGPAGFITGYRRADAADTLFVWQVAVSASMRRRGLARRMLDHLVARVPQVRWLEATVTPDNLPSAGLFGSFATRNQVELTREELFGERLLGDGHEPEVLYRIGPLA